MYGVFKYHTFYLELCVFSLWVCAAKSGCSKGPEMGVGSPVVSYRMWVLGITLGSSAPAVCPQLLSRLSCPSVFRLYMDTGI